MRALPLLLALLPTTLNATPADLNARVETLLHTALPTAQGTRWGLLVEDAQGHTIAALSPDERFQPASNTKIFVTTAVFDAMTRAPFPNPGTQVRLEPTPNGPQNVALIGKGDAMLSDRPTCKTDCLAQLADAVAATGVKTLNDVIGDDSFMPYERWIISGRIRPGTRTIISALTLNDNTMTITARPGPTPGTPATATTDLTPELTLITDIATTPPGTPAEIHADLTPGTRTIRLFGTIPTNSAPQTLTFDIDDPADVAAIRFARLLRARGIAITGTTRPRHAPITTQALLSTPTPTAPEPTPLATLTPPPILEDLTLTAKQSQNLHAHLFLKKLALTQNLTPTTPSGLTALNTTLTKAALPRQTYDFYDGSGLSPDNRITPRAMVQYLHWSAAQPWSAPWRTTLPIAGVDGTLSNRFRKTPLAGNLHAKTGTLLAANALAGYLTAASGQELTFAIYANDRPGSAPSVLPVMDAALVMIAAEN